MQLLKETGGKAIVLASAGNTGRAFAHVSALTGTDVYIVVPESGASNLWLPEEPTESVHLISMSPGNDYTDAINLAGRIAKLSGMFPSTGILSSSYFRSKDCLRISYSGGKNKLEIGRFRE